MPGRDGTSTPQTTDPSCDSGVDQRSSEPVDLCVVFLMNFFAPNMIAICQSWSTQVRQLVLLVSVAMEGNRAWQAEDGGLDVRVQKTWTRTRIDRHPGGYTDVNYVHIPLDTVGQLRRARPDVVVSSELGVRTILSALYCLSSGWFGLRRRRCRFIIAVSTSPWIERSRAGRLRTLQRRLLLRSADAVTSHGPECRDWLISLGVPDHKLFPFDYAADPVKVYTGPLQTCGAADATTLHVVTVGQLIARKGVVEGLAELSAVARRLPQLQIHWSILGDGPLLGTLKETPRPTNLHVDFRGNVDSAEIRAAYRQHEMMFFPTRGDEWGLVVDEAMHSGLVVLGNDRAQAVVTLVREDVNGYVYRPGDIHTLESAIVRYTARRSEERMEMRAAARQAVAGRTPEAAAGQIVDVLRVV